MPKVSVVMPVYNGARHIREAIESVLAQTFSDWDFWIVNEYGSNDGSAEIAADYARRDRRFHLVQNEERLGLAESLNLGFRLSSGEYIARLDADDLAHPERFAKQAALLDANPQVGICGTWQHHFGPNVDWVHRPQERAEDCRAHLLFNCDLCHSTLMLRRETVFRHELFYDSSFGAEDYELWCRAMLVTDIVNIPEVLGEYRVGEDNITAGKKQLLDAESGRLVARNLQAALGITMDAADYELFQGWSNPFDRFSDAVRRDRLKDFERLLRQVYGKNSKKHFCSDKALLSVLAGKWRWAKYHEPWDAQREIGELNQVFDENYRPSFRLRYRNFCAHNKTFRAKIRKICVVTLRPLARPFRRRIEGLLTNLERHICDFIEAKTWDRYLRLSAERKAEHEQLYTQMSMEMEALKERLAALERSTVLTVDGHFQRIEQSINRTTDERIWKAEQHILQTVDGRIWKAEQSILQTVDSRAWKAEQSIVQTVDGRIWKAEQHILQTVDGRIWRAEQSIQQATDSRIWQTDQAIGCTERRLVRHLDHLQETNKKKKIVLIGTPEHSNIGDAAIAVGEMEFISQYFPEYGLVELPANDFAERYEYTASSIQKGDIIFLQGGGNLGNKYLSEERIRRQVISDFPDNQIVIFPQTVFFDDDAEGAREWQISADIYNRHKNLLILVRGARSFAFVESRFPQAGCLCAPDMALMLQGEFDSRREGVLLCLRDMADESGLTETEYDEVRRIVRSIDAKAEITNNIYQNDYDSKIYSGIRKSVVRRELYRFAAHRVVVTDRLHGLIFAILTRTPCVVLSAYNYKIAEFCEGFADSETVRFLDRDVAGLERAIVQMMQSEFDAPPVSYGDMFQPVFEAITEGGKGIAG